MTRPSRWIVRSTLAHIPPSSLTHLFRWSLASIARFGSLHRSILPSLLSRYFLLLALVDPISGDGPNLGSNDGAFCYQLHSLPYRDFRPTLQLASSLFHDCPCWANGPWDEPLYWYGLVGDGILSDRDPHDLPSPFTLFENEVTP